MRDEGTGAAEHQVVAVSRMVAAGNAFTEQGKGCGDETDADDLAVFLDGHKLAVGHVPGGPGGERIADFPFSRSHDAGDVAALHLAWFGPQGARNGPVGIDDAIIQKPKASAYVFMDAARSCTGMDVSLISGCSLMPSSSE